ncbi:hypothetical protein CC2G_008290 [Coprinopsis cinerea AmutBmut pab1-1]|nr:hypothetical protein CC2G_008290 [Coprinopsis cinerea AmutBmut pab1-1]
MATNLSSDTQFTPTRLSLPLARDIFVLGTLPLGSSTYALQASRDGRFLAVGDEGGNLQIFSLFHGNLSKLRHLRARQPIRHIVWIPPSSNSSDVTVLFTAVNGMLYSVTFRDDGVGKDEVQSVRLRGFPHCLDVDEEYGYIALATGHSVQVYEIQGGDLNRLRRQQPPDLSRPRDSYPPTPNRLVNLIRSFPRNLHFVTISNGARLFVAVYPTAVEIWSVPDYFHIMSIPRSDGRYISSSACSPGGAKLAVHTFDGVEVYQLDGVQSKSVTVTRYGLSNKSTKVMAVSWLDPITIACGIPGAGVEVVDVGDGAGEGDAFDTAVQARGFDLSGSQTIAVGRLKNQQYVMFTLGSRAETKLYFALYLPPDHPPLEPAFFNSMPRHDVSLFPWIAVVILFLVQFWLLRNIDHKIDNSIQQPTAL